MFSLFEHEFRCGARRIESLSTIFCRILVSQLRFVPSRVIACISSKNFSAIFVLERLAPISKLSSLCDMSSGSGILDPATVGDAAARSADKNRLAKRT